jgi:hypothetical protein
MKAAKPLRCNTGNRQANYHSEWGLQPTISPANGPPHPLEPVCFSRPSGRSSVVEHDLAKVGVEGSNPFARSIVTIH